MSRIPPGPKPSDPAIAAMMEKWVATKGYAPTTWHAMLRRPKMFLAYRNLHSAVMMEEGEVPKALKFMVAAIVSAGVGDAYCATHNAENAAHIAGVPFEKVEALPDFASSPLFSEAERAALSLADAAGRDPQSVSDAHFDELRRHFSEDGIVEIVGVLGLLGWLNRIAMTLDTKLEPAPLEFAEKHLAKSGWKVG